MENNKNSLISFLLVIFIIVVLVVSSLGFYVLNEQVAQVLVQTEVLEQSVSINEKQSEKIEKLQNKIDQLKAKLAAKKESSAKENEKECYKTFSSKDLPEKNNTTTYTYNFNKEFSFEYPCNWNTKTRNQDSWSEAGTVVAPDGKASLHIPAPNFGLQGYDRVEVSQVTIDGKNYSVVTYSSDKERIKLIDMGTDLSEKKQKLMIAKDDSSRDEELQYILDTFKIKNQESE